MDIKAEKFLERQSSSNREIIEKIRKLISGNFPEVKETGMAEGLWYEGKFYIASFPDHVNLGVGIKGLPKEEADLFEGRGKTMRHLKFYSPEEVHEKELLKLMKIVYKKARCECSFKWKD